MKEYVEIEKIVVVTPIFHFKSQFPSCYPGFNKYDIDWVKYDAICINGANASMGYLAGLVRFEEIMLYGCTVSYFEMLLPQRLHLLKLM